MAKVKHKKEKDKVKHKRISQSFTGPMEKRILLWLAARIPRNINPLGFLAAILIGVSYVLSKNNPIFLWIASLGFIINWFGDSLDGTLARYRKIERPRYGYFLDHSIDVISFTIVLTGLAFSGYARLELAWAVNIVYLLLTLYTSFTNFTSRAFQISFAYVGPTELRILAIIASIWVYFNNAKFIHLPFGNYNFFEAVLILLVVVFLPAYLISTFTQIIRLSKEEPPPEY
ncbi:MAG: putative phosphatidyltransferase [Chloroflexi bacterium]|nr:MAG: putative phosphatidyltransferase [Chloroflexota bacterium]